MPQMSAVNVNEMEKARAAFLPHTNPYSTNFYSASNEMAKLSEMAASSQASMMNSMNGVNPLYSSQFYHNTSPMSAYLHHPGMQAAAVAACSGQPMNVNPAAAAAAMNMKYDSMSDSLRRPVPYVFPGQYLRDWFGDGKMQSYGMILVEINIPFFVTDFFSGAVIKKEKNPEVQWRPLEPWFPRLS